MTIKHIFIIGAGTMGNGVAQVAGTLSGNSVHGSFTRQETRDASR